MEDTVIVTQLYVMLCIIVIVAGEEVVKVYRHLNSLSADNLYGVVAA